MFAVFQRRCPPVRSFVGLKCDCRADVAPIRLSSYLGTRVSSLRVGKSLVFWELSVFRSWETWEFDIILFYLHDDLPISPLVRYSPVSVDRRQFPSRFGSYTLVRRSRDAAATSNIPREIGVILPSFPRIFPSAWRGAVLRLRSLAREPEKTRRLWNERRTRLPARTTRKSVASRPMEISFFSW